MKGSLSKIDCWNPNHMSLECKLVYLLNGFHIEVKRIKDLEIGRLRQSC